MEFTNDLEFMELLCNSQEILKDKADILADNMVKSNSVLKQLMDN